MRELFFLLCLRRCFSHCQKYPQAFPPTAPQPQNMRKIHFLSIYTQIYIFAAFFLFAVLSCCCTDPLPTELTGSAERLIWGTSTSECFLFLIKSDTDKELHLLRIDFIHRLFFCCWRNWASVTSRRARRLFLSSNWRVRNVPLCFASVRMWETSGWEKLQCCIWERSRYFPLCWDGLCPYRKKKDILPEANVQKYD